MEKEYGGYLPFEMRVGEDWFSRYGQSAVLRTNSAKAALYCAIQKTGIRKLYLPHYMCLSVKRMAADAGVETEFYDLNERLLPAMPHPVEADAAVVLVNYFGVMEAAVRQEAARYPLVFLDQSHAFFAEPLLREGAYSVYSCRKFFGVPDGGYLVGADAGGELEPDHVSGHFSYLVESLENGMNASYAQKQASDRYFLGNYRGMSRLSRGMLSAVDYAFVQQRRVDNFRTLHRLLKDWNAFSIPEEAVCAYLYPFLPKEDAPGAAALKPRLVARKIYVPSLWRELAVPEFEGKLEYRLSAQMAFLPVDQRCDGGDMQYLADVVKGLLSER